MTEKHRDRISLGACGGKGGEQGIPSLTDQSTGTLG